MSCKVYSEKIAPNRNKLYKKVITRWKDDFKWKILKLQNSKKLTMKMKNENEKWRWKIWRFFLLGQNISFYSFLKLWTSLISNMISDFSYLASIKSYSPTKWVHFACFCPFLGILSLLWIGILYNRDVGPRDP